MAPKLAIVSKIMMDRVHHAGHCRIAGVVGSKLLPDFDSSFLRALSREVISAGLKRDELLVSKVLS